MNAAGLEQGPSIMNHNVIFRAACVSLMIVGWAAAGQPRVVHEHPASNAASDQVAKCGDVLAAAKDAAGGKAWDRVTMIRQVGSLRAGGIKGTFESYEDVRTGRYYSEYHLGPLTGVEGFDGKVSWSQEQDGSVNVSESQSARESSANDAFRRARAFWYHQRWPAEVRAQDAQQQGSRRFRVLRFHPEGGRPFDMWIDAATSLVDRTVEPGATLTTTTFFSDYRKVGGILLPHVVRISTGEKKYDQVFRTQRVEINPEFKEQRFEVPAEKMTDFSIAGGKDQATLPFDLLNNHIYIKARVNGRGPLNLLVDTGGANLLTPTAARTLGIGSEGALAGRGTGEKTVDMSLAKVEKLTLGDVTLKDQVFYIVPLEPMTEVEGIPFHGLVGYEVFKRFVVKIDYADRLLVLRRPESFVYGGEGTPVPFVFDSQIPEVSGSIDGIAGWFKIDTGSRSALQLYGPFVEQHKLVEKYHAKVETLTGWGVGGGTRGRVVRAGELALGNEVVRGPVTALFSGTRGSGSNRDVAGSVGGGVLKRYTVTFDYHNKLMYLERNRNHDTPGNWDRSGMWINEEGPVFRVKDVVAGGPAELAGIRVGDGILAVDGKEAKDLSLSETRERLRALPAGTVVSLRLKTKEGTRTAHLKLRELIDSFTR